MFFYYTIKRRFLELLLTEALLSVVFNCLFRLNLLPSTKVNVCVAAFVLLAVFITLNIFMMRKCYKRISKDVIYFSINSIANGLFALVNLLVYFIFNRVAYTWAFSVFKSIHYAFNTGRAISALVIHLVLFLLIFASPYGIRVPKGEDMII